MLDGDFLSWFVNTDNDTATGSSFGFTGADYVIGRLPSGFVGVGRYSAATGTFELMSEGQPSGAFGARAHLGGFDPSTGTTFRVAGGASWTSSATGNSYHDFAPNPGLAPAPFAVHFTASAPPPPAPLPSPSPQPAPQPQPAPRVQRRPASAECTVPTLKRMRLSQAKKRLRSANCSVGKVKLVRSRRFAGRVVSTRPGRGTTLRAGAKVNLVVGRPEARATSAGVEAEAVRLIAAINALSRDR